MHMSLFFSSLSAYTYAIYRQDTSNDDADDDDDSWRRIIKNNKNKKNEKQIWK